jgi:DNA helicase-2/ATP-dependent DNA helicase PcrA
MKDISLTDEQLAVIHHPIGKHARVLAVAGSGKSFTMACRIQHLVQECHVAPHSIRVLMFNRLAREQFHTHLDRTGLPDTLLPEVHTFHSFSFQIINTMVRIGVLPGLMQFWTGEKEELVWLTAKRAIESLERSHRIPPNSIEAEDALNAISLWKGALLPPERAGSWSSPSMPIVYKEFEQMRLEKSALTFDDFIPMGVDILETNTVARKRWCGPVEYLIVDEYQDVNYGQQRLLELLMDGKADVMAVGDDDQTIYEWRGARPNYIVHDFEKVFNHKPNTMYRLSCSFRFGPTIAHAASILIHQNANRVKKDVIAYQQDKPGFIQVYNGGYASNKALMEQAQALIRADGILPKEIAILSRLYAQMDHLEAEFLNHHLPYRVEGHQPFFRRSEIKTLLDYIRLGKDFQEPMNGQIINLFLTLANKPNRMLSRAVLQRLACENDQFNLACENRFHGISLDRLLRNALYVYAYNLSRWQQQKLEEFWQLLTRISLGIKSNENAGELLREIVDQTQYLESFQNYYGEGEHADGKIMAVQNFLEYVGHTRLTPLNLLDHIARLDTTQGAPIEEQVVFTTIFRTKGLEYDYVFLPETNEGVLPYLKGASIDIYDTNKRFLEDPLSDRLESERRLFYVAITRARKGVFIGTGNHPSRFISEIQIQEVNA